MAVKDRNQNAQPGDTVRLKFFSFSAGACKDVFEIEKIDIFRLFCLERTTENPLGRELVETIDGSEAIRDDVGQHHIDLELDTLTYVVGRYQDEWHHKFEDDNQPTQKSTFDFGVFPNRWFTDSKPIIHDFSFTYLPTRFVKGSKKFMQIEIIPDVPRGTDKQRYYENIAKDGILFISMIQKCGDNLPQEEDLRIIIDEECVTEREGCFGFFRLDTEEIDCGLFDLVFKLELGPNIYISDRQPFQIFA